MSKPIQIFVAGQHTPMTGGAISFAESDLIASAKAYDPKLHEAPLVIGHPKHDAPAYGWVSALNYQEADQSLDITPDQVDPEFAEMHAAGRFKKRSASFYHPDSPKNPVPGVYYLKHVGFLGAMPPAVKGLKAAEFSENEDGVVTIEFGEEQRWAFSSITGIFRNLRDWLIENQGREEADKLLPGYAIDDVERAAQDEQVKPEPTQFSEQPIPEEDNVMTEEEKAAQAKREADLKAREEAVQFAEQKQQHEAAQAFVSEQIKANKLLPADEEGVLAFMSALSNLDAVSVEFGEDDNKQSLEPMTWFKDFVTRQPDQVNFGEHAAPEGEDRGGAVNFATPNGYDVDTNQMELHQQVLSYAETNGVSYQAALQAVNK